MSIDPFAKLFFGILLTEDEVVNIVYDEELDDKKFKNFKFEHIHNCDGVSVYGISIGPAYFISDYENKPIGTKLDTPDPAIVRDAEIEFFEYFKFIPQASAEWHLCTGLF